MIGRSGAVSLGLGDQREIEAGTMIVRIGGEPLLQACGIAELGDLLGELHPGPQRRDGRV